MLKGRNLKIKTAVIIHEIKKSPPVSAVYTFFSSLNKSPVISPQINITGKKTIMAPKNAISSFDIMVKIVKILIVIYPCLSFKSISHCLDFFKVKNEVFVWN